MLQKLNLYFETLPERLRPWRWWVVVLYIALMAFLAAGIPRFAFTWANDDMFGKDDPVQISLDRIKEMFGGKCGTRNGLHARRWQSVFSKKSGSFEVRS